ncbi:ethanolamine ammonia-lyase [bacterium]|nr:ethanolamine ammonia-lyase [bacterium]
MKKVDLKRVLGLADISKAGDRGAGLAASTETEREEARAVLSKLTLGYLYDNPLKTENGKVDAVMKANYRIDEAVFHKIAPLTLGEFKDRLLRSTGAEIEGYGKALTGVMAAAVSKLCNTHELVYIAKKISCPTTARTRLGLPGTLSSRLQPNHPIDDPRGIALLTYYGLSLASGDALLGVNPSIDTVDNISKVLVHLDKLRRETGAPTQICVLSHIKTQLACLEAGAPVEIIFQSLAGTESTNLTEFDLEIGLLDRAEAKMREKGPLGAAPNVFYFETGQGSEFTYGKHEGIDMATLEALCYGLARNYKPFMVNNVTGFIGPETHQTNFEMIYSSLQDHFMGKLLGVPMGMAPCYTLHSEITLEGQQMATQMLTAAGANYYMDVCLNTDRMLAYFDTSAHDVQTLREVYGKNPTPEFAVWAVDKGILQKGPQGVLERGPEWGRPEIFCASASDLESLRRATPSLYGFENAGPRPAESVNRSTRWNQAVAKDAVYRELDIARIRKAVPARLLSTQATNKEAHLGSPALGAELSRESAQLLKKEKKKVLVLLSDGLSAEAVHGNLTLFPLLKDLFALSKMEWAPYLVPYGRVKLAEPIAKASKAELILYFIGERPGGNAQAASSLSCYFVYSLRDKSARKRAVEFSGNEAVEFEYSVLSNIYPDGGLPPEEAAAIVFEKAKLILHNQAAGNRLEALV